MERHSNIRSKEKVGEDSEWREYSSTFSTQRLDRTLSHALRRKSGEDHPWPFKECRLLSPLYETVGGTILASPHNNLGASQPPFPPEQRWGGVFGSPTMGKVSWRDNVLLPHITQWVDCLRIVLHFSQTRLDGIFFRCGRIVCGSFQVCKFFPPVCRTN